MALIMADSSTIQASAIEAWLLGSAQIQEGPNQGGVIGWLDRDLSSRFAYGEITGYYLSYLTSPLSCSNSSQAMERALVWIRDRWIVDPRTRIYLDGNQDRDWRNAFSFSFDQVMMLRGICNATKLVDAGLSEPIVEEMYRHLTVFVGDDGLLTPCLPIVNQSIPNRWSTQKGPYQMKVAAVLLSVGESLPWRLRVCAENTCDHWAPFMPDVIATEELHSLLYFAEGLLLAWNTTREQRFLLRAQDILTRISDHLEGSFQEERVSTIVRADVIAQTLRLTCLLDAADMKRLQWLANLLAQFIEPDGAVYFHRSVTGQLQHANVWCGIFAAQALRYYSCVLQDGCAPSAQIKWLV